MTPTMIPLAKDILSLPTYLRKETDPAVIKEYLRTMAVEANYLHMALAEARHVGQARKDRIEQLLREADRRE